MPTILAAGAKAPHFTLRVTPDQTLSLSEFEGRRLILAFYPADWSPVCGDQMTLYNHVLSEFRKKGAELVGISVDGPWCHQAFARSGTCISPCSRISIPRPRFRGPMAPIATTSAKAPVRCLSSMRPARSPGAICPRSRSTLEQMAFSTPSIRCPTWSRKMSTLKVPVNPRDHWRGSLKASVTLVEYGDYQCPFCAAANPVVHALESRYRQDPRHRLSAFSSCGDSSLCRRSR